MKTRAKIKVTQQYVPLRVGKKLLVLFPEFARRVGVRPNAIRHVALDLEQLEVTRYKGRNYLDWLTQESAWKDYHARANGKDEESQPRNEDDSTVDSDPGEDIREGLKLGEAKAKQAVYEARLKRLTWEEKLGDLLPVDEVRKEWDRTARRVKKSVLAVSSRLAAVLAAEKDQFKVKRLLDTELKQALLNLDNVRDDDTDDESSDEEDEET